MNQLLQRAARLPGAGWGTVRTPSLDAAAENKKRAKEAVARFMKDHPKDKVPADAGDRIGIPLTDSAGKAIGYSTGRTVYSIWCRSVDDLVNGTRYYVAEYLSPPVEIVPDDHSVDAHEDGHVATTDDEITKNNNARKGKDGEPVKKDISLMDSGERIRDQVAENKKLRDAVSKANDAYDDANSHGHHQ